MRHLIALGAALAVCATVTAEPPAVKSFRTQKADDATYFRVEVAAPPHVAANRLMFETYTGGAAVAESLQLRRLMARDTRGDEGRVTSVSDMPGINIPEHPWAKMMGNDRPAPEPFARLIPADNYYVRFRDL